jgi:hypothetical protein
LEQAQQETWVVVRITSEMATWYALVNNLSSQRNPTRKDFSHTPFFTPAALPNVDAR